MTHPDLGALFAAVQLDPAADTPLYQQLYAEIRAAVLSGRLPAGARLPATRALAGALGLARSTVVNAFEQLLAEGYLESRVGAGTFVAADLPEALLPLSALPAPADPPTSAVGLSQRGMLLATARVSVISTPRPAQPFRHGLPDVGSFPLALWTRLLAQRYAAPTLLDYGDPAGHLPLRAAIADYLNAARGMHCRPEQVIIVSGSQQGLDLAVRLLLDPGDAVWLEDPGYLGARAALRAADATLIPVPVNTEGLDVAAGQALAPQARMAYVTPSHQFPLGVTLTLARRLALLAWAEAAGAWILEDDYDSEFRYAGRPLAALQSLDRAGRVIYLGTFSKVLFPGLRLGYLVVPPSLVGAFTAARAITDRQASGVTQAALADFIAGGHFARHIRRMRTHYAARREALIAGLALLGEQIELLPATAGMHLTALLAPGVDDTALTRRAAAYQLDIAPLSAYALGPLARGGLILGYAPFTPEAILAATQRLGRVVEAGG
jgi:GntR family transcriptional regulator/MocR family aminotransferase